MNTIAIKDIIIWAKEAGYVFRFVGNENDIIDGFSSLTKYKQGTITWIKRKVPTNSDLLGNIQLAVVEEGLEPDIKNRIEIHNSKNLFFGILKHFFSKQTKTEPIGAGTYIGEEVTIEEGVVIGHNCSIVGEIRIGKGTVIEHNVVIMNKVSIGEDCIIHSGTIIGKDGFGFSFDSNNIPAKVPHFGGVVIGNRVEIGCNCIIDRGTIDDTEIENDVKIDSGSGVAHNVHIGKATMIVGAGLAGSSTIGEKSYIAPRALVMNQQSVGSNTLIGTGVIVTKPIGDNKIVVQAIKKPVTSEDYRVFL